MEKVKIKFTKNCVIHADWNGEKGKVAEVEKHHANDLIVAQCAQLASANAKITLTEPKQSESDPE